MRCHGDGRDRWCRFGCESGSRCGRGGRRRGAAGLGCWGGAPLSRCGEDVADHGFGAGGGFDVGAAGGTVEFGCVLVAVEQVVAAELVHGRDRGGQVVGLLGSGDGVRGEVGVDDPVAPRPGGRACGGDRRGGPWRRRRDGGGDAGRRQWCATGVDAARVGGLVEVLEQGELGLGFYCSGYPSAARSAYTSGVSSAASGCRGPSGTGSWSSIRAISR